MPKNDLIRRQQAKIDAAYQAGEETGEQWGADMMAIALRELGVPKTKIIAATEQAMHISKELSRALLCNLDPEADYYQEVIDRKMRDIFGDKYAPFEQRYSYLKKVRY